MNREAFSSSFDADDDEPIAAINIIPLVDVVLVLLIIFMVTAVFTRESALKIDLPATAYARPAEPPVEVDVTVDRAAAIWVNGVPAGLDDLPARLKQATGADPNRKALVVLRGDRRAPYGAVAEVLDHINQSGMEVTIALTRENPR